MRYCPKCDLNIRGDALQCPLCRAATVPTSPADGDSHDYGKVFPDVPTVLQKYNVILRLSLFIALAVSAITVGINLMVPHTSMWSLFVILGCGCLLVSIFTALQRRFNIQRNLLNQATLVCVFSVLFDYLTKWRGWSVDFVVPILLPLSAVMMIVLGMVLHIKLSQYIIYLLLASVYSLIPIILLACGVVQIIYPSYISIIIGALLLITLTVMFTNKLLAELRRRIHM